MSRGRNGKVLMTRGLRHHETLQAQVRIDVRGSLRLDVNRLMGRNSDPASTSMCAFRF